MYAIKAVSSSRYARKMQPPRTGGSEGKPRKRRQHIARPRVPKIYPNRIAELTKARGLTYAAVGDAVNAHEITIAKLANGNQELTLGWMQRLAKVFSVTPSEIITKAPGEGMRSVRVTGFLPATDPEDATWPEGRRYDVMIPDDPALRGDQLYACEIRGESMDRKYPAGTVVILSRMDADKTSHLKEGRHYHVRRQRNGGAAEDSLKTLIKVDGSFWLKPESSSPQHQEWIALFPTNGELVELIGRVRYSVQRED
jgi:transcriptional regulator with XRE-family HTH domain